MLRPALLLTAALTSAVLAQETVVATAPATVPATAPATTKAATRPVAEVSSAAQPLLEALNKTYAAAVPLRVTAKVEGRFDVAGRSRNYAMSITSQTPDGVKFVHHAAGYGLAVSNGKRGFLFDERRKAYIAIEVAATRPAPADVDEAITDVLLEENAALLLALTTDAAGLLKGLAARIDTGEAATIDDVPHASLVLTRKDDATVTLFIAPASGLIRRAFVDYRSLLKARGATAINAGDATVDFIVSQALEGDEKQYDWQPPEDADEIDLGRELMKAVGRKITGPSTQPSDD